MLVLLWINYCFWLALQKGFLSKLKQCIKQGGIIFGDMLYSKSYARVEDMSLPKHTLVAILSLNECVPESHGVIWTTKKEMTRRLIHCGVHNSLETIDVADTIQKHNQRCRINKNWWKDHDTRSSLSYEWGIQWTNYKTSKKNKSTRFDHQSS